MANKFSKFKKYLWPIVVGTATCTISGSAVSLAISSNNNTNDSSKNVTELSNNVETLQDKTIPDDVDPNTSYWYGQDNSSYSTIDISNISGISNISPFLLLTNQSSKQWLQQIVFSKIDDLVYNVNKNSASYNATSSINFATHKTSDDKYISTISNNLPQVLYGYDDNYEGAIYVRAQIVGCWKISSSNTTMNSPYRWIKITGFKKSLESPSVDKNLIFSQAFTNMYPSEFFQKYKNLIGNGTQSLDSFSNVINELSKDFLGFNIDDFPTTIALDNNGNPIQFNSVNMLQTDFSNMTGYYNFSFNINYRFVNQQFFDKDLNKTITVGRIVGPYNPDQDFSLPSYKTFTNENDPSSLNIFKSGVTKFVNNVININDPLKNGGISNPLSQIVNKDAIVANSIINQNSNLVDALKSIILSQCFFNDNGTSFVSINDANKNSTPSNATNITSFKYESDSVNDLIKITVQLSNVIEDQTINSNNGVNYEIYLTGFNTPLLIVQNQNYPTVDIGQNSAPPFNLIDYKTVFTDMYNEFKAHTSLDNATTFKSFFTIVYQPKDVIYTLNTINFGQFSSSSTTNNVFVDSVVLNDNYNNTYVFDNNGLGYEFKFPKIIKNTVFPKELTINSSYYPFQCITNDSSLISERNIKLAQMIIDYIKNNSNSLPPNFTTSDIIIDNNSFVIDNHAGTVSFNYQAKNYYGMDGNPNTSDPGFVRNLIIYGLKFPSSATAVYINDDYLTPVINASGQTVNVSEFNPTKIKAEVDKYLASANGDLNLYNQYVSNLINFFFVVQDLPINTSPANQTLSSYNNFEITNSNNTNGTIDISFDIIGYFSYNQSNQLIYIKDNNQPLHIQYTLHFFNTIKPTILNTPIKLTEDLNILTHEFVEGCFPNGSQQWLSYLKQLIYTNITGDIPNISNINVDDYITFNDFKVNGLNGQLISFKDLNNNTSDEYKKALDYLDANKQFYVDLTLSQCYDQDGNIQYNVQKEVLIDGKDIGFKTVSSTLWKTLEDDNYEITVPNCTNIVSSSWATKENIENYIWGLPCYNVDQNNFNFMSALKGTVPQSLNIKRDLIIDESSIDTTISPSGRFKVNLSLRTYFQVQNGNDATFVFDNQNGYTETTTVTFAGFETQENTDAKKDANISISPNNVDITQTIASIAVDGKGYSSSNDKVKCLVTSQWQEIIFNNVLTGGKKNISPSDISNITFPKIDDTTGSIWVSFNLNKYWENYQLKTGSKPFNNIKINGFLTQKATQFTNIDQQASQDSNKPTITIDLHQSNISASDKYNATSMTDWRNLITSNITVINNPTYYFDPENNYQFKNDINLNNNLVINTPAPDAIDDTKGTITFSDVTFNYFFNTIDGLLTTNKVANNNTHKGEYYYDYKDIGIDNSNIGNKTNSLDNVNPLDNYSQIINTNLQKVDIVFKGFAPVSDTQVKANQTQFDITKDPILSKYYDVGIWSVVNNLNNAKDSNGDYNTVYKDFRTFLYNNAFVENTNKEQIVDTDIEIKFNGNINGYVDKMNGQFSLIFVLNAYWKNGEFINSTSPNFVPIERKYVFTGFQVPTPTEVENNKSINVQNYNWAQKNVPSQLATQINQYITTAGKPVDNPQNGENIEQKITDNDSIIKQIKEEIFNNCVKGIQNGKISNTSNLSWKNIWIVGVDNPDNINGTLNIQFQVGNMWIQNSDTQDVSKYPINNNTGPNNKVFNVTLTNIQQSKQTIISPSTINLNDYIYQDGIKFNVHKMTADDFLNNGYENDKNFNDVVKKLFKNNPNLISNTPNNFNIDNDLIISSSTIYNNLDDPSDPKNGSIELNLNLQNVYNELGEPVASLPVTVYLTGFKTTSGPTSFVDGTTQTLNGELLKYVNESNVSSTAFADILQNPNALGNDKVIKLFNEYCYNYWVNQDSNIEGLNQDNICYVPSSIVADPFEKTLKVDIYLDKFHASINSSETKVGQLIDNTSKSVDEQIVSAKQNHLYKTIIIKGFQTPTSNNGITTTTNQKEFWITDWTFNNENCSNVPAGITVPVFKDLLPSEVVDILGTNINFLKIWALANLYGGNLEDIYSGQYNDFNAIDNFITTYDDVEGTVTITSVSLKHYWDYKDPNNSSSGVEIKNNGKELNNIIIRGFKQLKQTNVNNNQTYNLTSNDNWINNIPSNSPYANSMNEIYKNISKMNTKDFFNWVNSSTENQNNWKIYVYKWIANYYVNHLNSSDNIFNNLPPVVDQALKDFVNDWNFKNGTSDTFDNLLNHIQINTLLSPSIISNQEIQVPISIKPKFTNSSSDPIDEWYNGNLTFNGFNAASEPTIIRNMTQISVNPSKTNGCDGSVDLPMGNNSDKWYNMTAQEVANLQDFEAIVVNEVILNPDTHILGGRLNDVNNAANIQIDSTTVVDTQGRIVVTFHLNKFWVSGNINMSSWDNKQEYTLNLVNFNVPTISTEVSQSIIPFILGGVGAGVALLIILIIIIILVKRRRDIEYQQ